MNKVSAYQILYCCFTPINCTNLQKYFLKRNSQMHVTRIGQVNTIVCSTKPHYSVTIPIFSFFSNSFKETWEKAWTRCRKIGHQLSLTHHHFNQRTSHFITKYISSTNYSEVFFHIHLFYSVGKSRKRFEERRAFKC